MYCAGNDLKNKEDLGQNLTYLLKALNGWSAFKSAAEKDEDKSEFVGMTQNRSLRGGLRENRKR